ncbi:hypothetical protein KC316_g41 [Hortaea werneckii]|nr:hypothetical protein KC316_g41 [Hortaea werneckii]
MTDSVCTSASVFLESGELPICAMRASSFFTRNSFCRLSSFFSRINYHPRLKARYHHARSPSQDVRAALADTLIAVEHFLLQFRNFIFLHVGGIILLGFRLSANLGDEGFE